MQPAATTSNGTTSFEVETDFAAADPRVARSSQPWAGGRNPFGIEDAYKVQSLCPHLCLKNIVLDIFALFLHSQDGDWCRKDQRALGGPASSGATEPSFSGTD